MERKESTTNPPEMTREQRTRGVKDKDRREKPKEDEKRAPLHLQPTPKTPGESQTKGVKVVLKKTPLQKGKEGTRHVERPKLGPEEGWEQEGSPKTRTPTETGPLGTNGGNREKKGGTAPRGVKEDPRTLPGRKKTGWMESRKNRPTGKR